MKKSLPPLTSLRFPAAMVVFVGHLEGYFPDDLPVILRGWLGSGYSAVTFFFVLSGFVMYYAHANNTDESNSAVESLKFYRARIARIVPAYYLALAIAFPIFVYGTHVAGVVPLHEFFTGLVLVPLLLQAWYPPASFAWNGPAWSLSVEMFFYASFPLILLSANRVSRTALLGLASLMVVVSSVLVGIAPRGDEAFSDMMKFLNFFPLFHIGSFIFGIAVARIFLFGNPHSSASCTRLFLGATLIVLVLLGARDVLPEWALSNAFLVPLFSIIIFGASRLQGRLGSLLSNKTVVLLGDSSYSIYILHTPIVFWLAQADKRLGLELSDAAFLVSAIVIVISTSVLTYLAFEKPLRAKIVGADYKCRINVMVERG